MIRKITSLLSLLVLGTGMQAVAGEHEDHQSFNYSVYGSYRYMKVADAGKVLATQQQAKMFLPGWNATPDKLTGMFRDMYGPAAAVQGGTNLQKAQKLMNGKLAAMGINASEWVNTRDMAADHAAFVDFKQVVAGHNVIFSNLSFRFTPDGRLQRVKMQNYGTPEQGLQPELTNTQVLNGNAITQDLPGVYINDKSVESDWVWFPIPTKNGYVIHPAWPFKVIGTGAHEMPVELIGYIDAITGELLYRSNQVNQTFEVKVTGSIHMATPAAPTTQVAMNNMIVRISGQDYVTDDTGFVSIASANAPLSATYRVRGPWSDVRVGGSTPSFTANMNTSPAIFDLPISDTTTSDFRAVSAFYHVNKIHNYIKGHWPNFTNMDNNPLRTNVDINGTTCNAFYNNGAYSINFYPPQGTSCRAYSMVSDIVYHEYGHGISYRFYDAYSQFFSNGALGEGNSDVWAMCMNGDGIVGDGANFNGGNIRSYIGAPKVYPTDIVGEVHADGEIIAGAWWDVAVNTGSSDTMAKLFALTHYDLPNGPNGKEGEVYHDILISALMNDDDDANLGNGTPHFNQIIAAFARHGIYLLSDAEFEHTEVDHQPVNTPVVISGKLILSNPAFFDKIYLHYRNRSVGTWDSVAMVNTTANDYSAQIPGQPAGSIVDYFFNAQDVVAASAFGLPRGYSPVISSSEVTLPYQYGVGLGNKRYVYDFEGNIDGWEMGISTDNASGGIWENDVPGGTTSGGEEVQTGKDHTTGTGKCMLTGNQQLFGSVSADDVDNGKTTLRTPFFDLPFHEPVVEYYRWYSNDRGSNSNLRGDFWTVEMRLPSSSLWKRVDYTKESDQRWRRRIFRVSEFFPSPTSVQLQFIAEDRVTSGTNDGQNIVEAAVDDFIIYEGSPLSVNNTQLNIRSQVYPNPADKTVYVAVPENSKGSITLYDVTGKVITTADVTSEKTQYSINTANIAAGTYMVLIQTQYAVQNATVVISHQ